MEAKILPYTPAYFDSFVKLLAVAFEMKSRNKAALIKWKFFPPSFKNKTISYVALTNKKEVIAQYTNIPFPISYFL